MAHVALRFVTAMLIALCAAPVFAQTVNHDTSEHESASAHESAHESHQNVVSFFAGVTHAGRRKNCAALGVGYERLLFVDDEVLILGAVFGKGI